MRILFIVVMHIVLQALSLASLQACCLNKGNKHSNKCKRQTIWLFTKRDGGFEISFEFILKLDGNTELARTDVIMVEQREFTF